MSETTLQNNHSFALVYFSLCTSIAFALLLFFVDEGYYSFQWMAEMGSWVAFCIYSFVFFISQMIVGNLISDKINFPIRSVLTLVIGLSLGLYITMGLIFA